MTLERGAQLIQELREIFSECSIENWDGYGALPIQEQAVLEAERFIAVLCGALNYVAQFSQNAEIAR